MRVSKFNGICLGIGIALFILPFSSAWAQNTPAGDNSKVNQRDQSQSEPTADQQKNNKSDLDITKAIRQSLVKDKSLSTYAHNVKVIAQNGKVTLKGPVRSDEEKSTVVGKAAQVVGHANITDEMTVVPKHD
jgi:hyperosmotically inducible periplasmic protein